MLVPAYGQTTVEDALIIRLNLSIVGHCSLWVRNVGIDAGTEVGEDPYCGMRIGTRNKLFAGADSGGERAAALYSLIGTARLNGSPPKHGCVT